MLIQLNPPIPLIVVGGKVGDQEWTGPTGNGMAILVKSLSPDHHLTWIIIMDTTGQIWEVENPFVRGDKNITWGRPSIDRPKENV